MDIPITLVTLFENFIIGVLLGSSTIAVLSYALSLKYGYPQEGTAGRHLIQTIYTVIRFFHICMLILVTILFLLYGIFDSIESVQVEYGIKFFVLVVNAVIAYCMARHILSVKELAPFIAAGWYFLATFHSYSLFIEVDSIIIPLVIYLCYSVVFKIIFKLFHKFIHCVDDSKNNDIEVKDN